MIQRRINPVSGGVSLRPVVFAAVLFHLAIAFHNYCGVDGANYFSYYSQYAFGLPGGRCNYFSASFSSFVIPHLVSCFLFIPLTVCIKFINALCWIACSYIVVKYYCDPDRRSSLWWFICLAFNPVAIFDIHYHVQYEAVVLFLMISGLLFYRQRGRSPKILAGLSWALAVSVKAFPALLVPLFIFDRRSSARDKLLFYSSFIFFFFLPEIPWICKIGWSQTFTRAVAYRSFYRFGLYRIVEGVSDTGVFGLFPGQLFRIADSWVGIIACVLVLVVGLLIFFRRISLFRAMGFYLALLLLLSTRNAPQYLIFVIPFLVLFESRPALIFANASYAVILAFFYLLDSEMSGSYCLLKPLSYFSISQESLAFWGGWSRQISLYLWGYLYLIASFIFVFVYCPKDRWADTRSGIFERWGVKPRRLVWVGLILFWGLAFFSISFSWNPFSVPGDGLSDVVKSNTVLEPASTLGWYGSTGEYELTFKRLAPDEKVLLSGDSYYSVQIGDRTFGPFRGDGNKYYSFWWGVSHDVGYDGLEKAGFKATIVNHLCSTRGVNTITGKVIKPGQDWSTYGHRLGGKIQDVKCRVDGTDYDVEFGERDGRWLTIRPKDYRLVGGRLLNIFNIILVYIGVFFVVVGLRLRFTR